ncbi:MAG: YebC/PmpR family DNA-binding transcriptional regulator [Candidatus Goldiibacteriota bacterium HGW-Goldbacteria-1]|jgi:YebC/PmpR family DNA-binding regulatory protein|nr:MAG: YebC/PmpR family DNA-binding transcriptional regulator [Candidatus Goldiibacteriota bacterium HGW-Goldbacteria-1]
MSGHSKWATIKRKKASIDSKRGAAFTKIIKEIVVAARAGGGDLDGNARLRTVVDKAKAANMPYDNIKKAIMRGTGELEGITYEELMYEGYGPAGVALLIAVTTDNKNRSAASVRAILSKANGAMAALGAVAWQFEQKGYITVPKEEIDEDTLMSIALEAGADDIQNEDATYDISTKPADFETVKKALDDKKVKYSSAEVTMVPKNYVKVEGKAAEQMLRLMDALDEDEDVQNVYANFDISQEEMDRIGNLPE